jgi:hypothetical protein
VQRVVVVQRVGSQVHPVQMHQPRDIWWNDYGGYYTVGRLFVKAIGDDRVMRLATRHGLPHPVLMRFVLKLMANLTDTRGGDAMDKVVNALSRLAPAA